MTLFQDLRLDRWHDPREGPLEAGLGGNHATFEASKFEI